jgi:hypothetical protein
MEPPVRIRPVLAAALLLGGCAHKGPRGEHYSTILFNCAAPTALHF